MSVERTFAIIKPDAVRKGYIGNIIARQEAEGLKPVGIRLLHMSRAQAEEFYGVHRERPFFASLVEFMTSGPCVVMALEAPDAIVRWRTLMGATNPANAAPGTLRALYAESVQNNAVHGSDAPETAKVEVAFFFPEL